MKFLLLLSFVVFVASGAEGQYSARPGMTTDRPAEGLKCRCSAGLCDGPSRKEGTLTCPDIYDACYTATVSYGGQSATTFGCGTKNMENDCGGTYGGTCTCTTDLCNGAARPGMTTATFALILFAAVAKYVFA